MIRVMKIDDMEDVLDMMSVFYESPAVIHKADKEILRKDILDCVGDCPYIKGYIFEKDGQCAGYAMVAKGYSTEYGGVCLWIEDLYIKPQFRGCGISREFFDTIEEESSGYVVRMRLEAEKENKRALKVYSAAGYEESPYIVMDKVIDRK